MSYAYALLVISMQSAQDSSQKAKTKGKVKTKIQLNKWNNKSYSRNKISLYFTNAPAVDPGVVSATVLAVALLLALELANDIELLCKHVAAIVDALAFLCIVAPLCASCVLCNSISNKLFAD